MSFTAANLWIMEHGQVFRRKCGLTADDLYWRNFTWPHWFDLIWPLRSDLTSYLTWPLGPDQIWPYLTWSCLNVVSHQTVAASYPRRTYSLGNTTKWTLFWLAQLFLKSLTPTLLRSYHPDKHLSAGTERKKNSVRDYKNQAENKVFCQHPRWCIEIYPKML